MYSFLLRGSFDLGSFLLFVGGLGEGGILSGSVGGRCIVKEVGGNKRGVVRSGGPRQWIEALVVEGRCGVKWSIIGCSKENCALTVHHFIIIVDVDKRSKNDGNITS